MKEKILIVDDEWKGLQKVLSEGLKIPKELIDQTKQNMQIASRSPEEIRAIQKATNKRRNKASTRLVNKMNGGFSQ